VLSELAVDPAKVRVLLGNPDGERLELTLAELLPHAFRKTDLDDLA
jgi:cytidine deaminase